MEQASANTATVLRGLIEQRLASLYKNLADAEKKVKEWSEVVEKAVREDALREKLAEYEELRDYWERKVKEIKAEIAELAGKLIAARSSQQSDPVTHNAWHLKTMYQLSLLELQNKCFNNSLRRTPFPCDPQAYEFPKFNVSIDNPNHESIKSADIRTTWKEPHIPDFLLSGLHKPVVTLVQMNWRKAERRLTLTIEDSRNVVAANPTVGSGRYVVLVSTSGSGKTRFLLERAWKDFACLFFGGTKVGAGDISTALGMLPQAATNETSTEIRNVMDTLIAIRSLILAHLRKIMPEFQPRHWMALQLYPDQILPTNVFLDLFEALRKSFVSAIVANNRFLASGMTFIAIDEAQVVDKTDYPDMRLGLSGQPRSALRPLVDALVKQNYGVVLSGTAMHLVSAIELLELGIGKMDHVETYGTTTTFDSVMVEEAVRDRGYVNGDIDPYARDLFCGRPRFAMDLAAGLLMGTDWKESAKRIEEDLYNMANTLGDVPAPSAQSGTKSLLPQLVFTATEYALKGLGGISAHGEVALEVGACAINFSKRIRLYEGEKTKTLSEQNQIDAYSASKRPLVIKALQRFGSQTFLELTNETDAQIGLQFEYYVAMHAQELFSAIHAIALEKCNTGELQFEPFKGPWVVPNPSGNMRRGMRCKDGMDAVALENIVRNSESGGGGGLSLLFPCEGFGADLVVVARRESDGGFLLLFVQCKACMKVPTPEALKSLLLPYHQHRDKRVPKVPNRYQSSLKDLQRVLERDDVCVAFAAFKYPAKSQASVPEAEVVDYVVPSIQGARKIKVLKVVFDDRNAKTRLPQLLQGPENAKRTRQEMFLHDE